MFQEPNPENHGFPTLEIDEDGTRRWFLNGELHRDDGPAVEYLSGIKIWLLKGRRHRINGPAFESSNGSKEYWLNGKRYSEEEFQRRVKSNV